MNDDRDPTIHMLLDRLYPSLDDVPEDWDRVVADAGPERRRLAPAGLARWPALRVAAVGAAVAAIALGVLSAAPGGGPSPLARAVAALTPADGAILHTVALVTDRGPGRTTTSRTETWQQSAPPYDELELTGAGGREFATADGRPEVYDPRTNTIFRLPPGAEVPDRLAPQRPGERVRDVMLGLLRSGEARVEGRVVVEGREAIRIAAPASASHPTVLVDAATYEPIEWTVTSDEGIRQTTRFLIYEHLPATAENLAQLSLSARHPGARVDREHFSIDPDPSGKG
jgi:hypothetical protein